MIFNKISEIKAKFKSWFISKKKLVALENYSAAAPFKYKNSLILIRNCIEEGFLNEKGADFLNSILDEYEISFLDWAHKTKWLKGQMKTMKEAQENARVDQLMLFDYDKKASTPNIPLEILAKAKNAKGVRI